jgi:hypothetical protein
MNEKLVTTVLHFRSHIGNQAAKIMVKLALSVMLANLLTCLILLTSLLAFWSHFPNPLAFTLQSAKLLAFVCSFCYQLLTLIVL